MEEIVLGYNTLFVWADKSYYAGGSIETFVITDNIRTNKNTIIMENGRIDYGTSGRNITSKSGNQISSMILFGTSNYGNTPIPISAYNMKVYRLKLYENNVLVREYVPCYRENDNAIGLYELVNNVFYPNNGTGTFNKGNDIVTSGTMANQHFIYNVAQNIQNNSFSRAGYEFNGWNTKQDGTGTSYEEGQSVSELTTIDNAIVNLYGQWILIGDTIADDIHLADGSWNEDEGINTPKLVDGLIPVTFNNDGSVTELSSEDYSDWYDYSNKKYANAITKDQNDNITGYWVWIPRYEYIVNSATESFTVKFIPVTQTVEDSGYDHIHPSFRDGSQTHYMNGEWDSELPGFWVAKFPAGFQKNTITDSNGTLSIDISNSEDQPVFSDKKYTFIYTWGDLVTRMGTINTETNMSLPVFNPLTYAYSDICAGDSYTLAKEVSKNSDFYGLNQNSDSHLLKNSEWGAVTYLAQSQYGRNGTEISINNFYADSESNEDQYHGITGNYADGSEEWMSDTLGNAWYTEIGQGGSSTGNITGIYDLNGCVGERTACYISNESYNLDLNKGISNWINTTANVNGYQTLSSKYYTVYPYDSNNDTDTGNWSKYNSLSSTTYGYGDAILETSTSGTGQNSWFVAHSVFFEADFPFMERGGASGSGLYAGGFCYEEGPGIGNPSVGFRVVLCP